MLPNQDLYADVGRVESANPTQKRLKTALALHRNRKIQFRNQLESRKESAHDLAADPSKSRNLFSGSNLHDLGKAHQLETLKSQCRQNNDYKSMAAISRIQQNVSLKAPNHYYEPNADIPRRHFRGGDDMAQF